MSWLSNAFKHRDPEKEANKYLDKIPGQSKELYDPYMNAGKESLDKLKTYYDQLMNNPGEAFNKLGEGYKQSPGYAATLREALSGANNAAALGGGGGLGAYGHQELAAGAAGDVANKDYEQYINHILGLNKQGVEGQQGIENQGYNATQNYGDILNSTANARATNAANAAGAQNQRSSQNWSNLFSTLGGFAGGLYGGFTG
jgi:hypothetical protein